jgi:hypothetical protein
VIGRGGETTIHVMDADGTNGRKLVEGHAMLGAYAPDDKRLGPFFVSWTPTARTSRN